MVVQECHSLIGIAVVLLCVRHHICEVAHGSREGAKSRAGCPVELKIQIIYSSLLGEIHVLIVFGVRTPNKEFTKMCDCSIGVHSILEPLYKCRVHMKRCIMPDTVHAQTSPEQYRILQVAHDLAVLLGEISKGTQVLVTIPKSRRIIPSIAKSMEPAVDVVVWICDQILYQPIVIIIIRLTVCIECKFSVFLPVWLVQPSVLGHIGCRRINLAAGVIGHKIDDELNPIILQGIAEFFELI